MDWRDDLILSESLDQINFDLLMYQKLLCPLPAQRDPCRMHDVVSIAQISLLAANLECCMAAFLNHQYVTPTFVRKWELNLRFAGRGNRMLKYILFYLSKKNKK